MGRKPITARSRAQIDMQGIVIEQVFWCQCEGEDYGTGVDSVSIGKLGHTA